MGGGDAAVIEFLYNPPTALYLLAGVIFFWLFLRAVGEQAQPILVEMTKSLAKTAGKNASLVLMACAFGLAASLTAIYDVYKDMDQDTWQALSWPQVFAYCAKVLAPFVSGSTAYVVGRSPAKTGAETNSPFPPQTTQ